MILIKRILSQKNILIRYFKWVKTVICGDFNAGTVKGNKKIRKTSRKLKMKNIFWKKSGDKTLIGRYIFNFEFLLI